MATDNKLLDDLARVASGAMSAVAGARQDIEARMRDRLERVLSRMDLVTREEFEVVREMASRARAGEEALAERVTALEAALAAKSPPEKPAKAPRRRKTT